MNYQQVIEFGTEIGQYYLCLGAFLGFVSGFFIGGLLATWIADRKD